MSSVLAVAALGCREYWVRQATDNTEDSQSNSLYQEGQQLVFDRLRVETLVFWNLKSRRRRGPGKSVLCFMQPGASACVATKVAYRVDGVSGDVVACLQDWLAQIPSCSGSFTDRWRAASTRNVEGVLPTRISINVLFAPGELRDSFSMSFEVDQRAVRSSRCGVAVRNCSKRWLSHESPR